MSAQRRFDYEFLNTAVRVIALRDFPETPLAGLVVGPFKEGETYMVYYWVAEGLEKEGVVKIGEESVLTLEQLERLRWLQSTQGANALLPLPTHFYQMAKRLVAKLLDSEDPAKAQAGERAARALQDLANLRTAIIVRRALSEFAKPPANQTPEEETLYWELHKSIDEHKKAVTGRK